MQLVADRFAVQDDGRAFDLSTGAPVTLIVHGAGGISDQVRWSARCDALYRLRHRSMATLVDYGLVGESSRFEAWDCGGVSTTQGTDDAVAVRAARWLRACGLSTTPRSSKRADRRDGGGALWVPDSGTGYPDAEPDIDDSLTVDDCGLQIVEHSAVSTLAEMFHSTDARPRLSVLWGAAGAGKRLVAGQLARIARSRGFVPIAARTIQSRQAELWRGRTLFLIADAADAGVWQAFVHAGLTDALPHVLLLVGEEECRSIAGVGLGRLSPEALISSVRPPLRDRRCAAAVRKAAERARGLPGRFVRLLWPTWPACQPFPPVSPGVSAARVAEQTATYGEAETGEDLFQKAGAPSVWPAPGELAALRRKMADAIAQLANGRYAPGIRQLRQVLGCLVRRGAWSDAAHGSRELTRALLRRGQARDALAAIGDGRDYASRAGEERILIELAIAAGHAWIDLGRLDESDSVLGTALSAARALQEPAGIAAASIASARVSYWRGDYADADGILEASPCIAAFHVQRALLAARIAAGLGDPGRAMSLLGAASGSATGDDEETRGAAAWVRAVVHFGIGDLSAAEQDLAAAAALAGAVRNRQRLGRVRLLRIELLRASRGSAAARASLERLRRVMANAPPLLRARWNLALALSNADAAATVAKHVRTSGLPALGRYVWDAASRRPASAPGGDSGPSTGANRFTSAPALLDDLVAIVRACQTAADETELLKDVCARVRRHLHASAVTCAAARGGGMQALVFDGARVETDVGNRAAAAGVAIAPHRLNDRVEAAAPILYGGAAIGALSARWTIGSMYDTSRATAVLTMSATAMAPLLAAIIARHSAAPAGVGDLIGVAPATIALRDHVARAAGAPFGVLVDGESGSGKELVARAIHRGSARRHKAFCTLNCAALPDELVEAELFGHTRGAFTGAVGERPGVFEEADGGTLFLDEVGELTPRAQAKVLRVLQDGELRRIGANVSRRVDVRIVSATNRALREEVEAGRFRLDLLYRLDVVHIRVPPLRERREDVAVLAEHFWRDATERVGSRATLAPTTIAALARYDWPGNVRELQNVLAALAVRTPKRGLVPPSALPPCFGHARALESSSLDEARRTFEHSFVRAALIRTGGHRGRAAAELGVTRQGLAKLMTRLGL